MPKDEPTAEAKSNWKPHSVGVPSEPKAEIPSFSSAPEKLNEPEESKVDEAAQLKKSQDRIRRKNFRMLV